MEDLTEKPSREEADKERLEQRDGVVGEIQKFTKEKGVVNEWHLFDRMYELSWRTSKDVATMETERCRDCNKFLGEDGVEYELSYQEGKGGAEGPYTKDVYVISYLAGDERRTLVAINVLGRKGLSLHRELPDRKIAISSMGSPEQPWPNDFLNSDLIKIPEGAVDPVEEARRVLNNLGSSTQKGNSYESILAIQEKYREAA